MIIKKNKIAIAALILALMVSFPKINVFSSEQAVTTDTEQVLDLSAKSAALFDMDSGRMLYEKNAQEKLPMASTTKIMTCLILLEWTDDLSQEVTVTKEMINVEGSSMYLKAGDVISLEELSYGLMLKSGNDAANVIAYTVGGDLLSFAELMNQKSQELGMTNTHFVTPSGLDAEEHYTTAEDFGKLAVYAMKNRMFRTVVSTRGITLTYGTPQTKHYIKSHNRMLLYYDGALGVKTGFTKKSGRCLVSAAERSSVGLIAVTLNAPNDWSDHKKMLDYGFANYKLTEVKVQREELTVAGSAVKSIGFTHDPVELMLTEEEANLITTELLVPSFLYAPIKKGDIIGNIVIYLNGYKMAEVMIYADSDAPKFEEQSFKTKFNYSFKELLGQMT